MSIKKINLNSLILKEQLWKDIFDIKVASMLYLGGYHFIIAKDIARKPLGKSLFGVSSRTYAKLEGDIKNAY